MIEGSGENGNGSGRPTIAELASLEAKRVNELLLRDRRTAKRERKRRDAEIEVAEGKFGNIDDTVVEPTPELLRTGAFEPYRPDKTEGTVRSLATLRRVQSNRIVQLHQRGVLDDDTFPAVLWYRRTWDGCGFDLSASAAAWGEQIRGERAYGFGPKTPAQVEERRNFRFAREFVPDDMIATFDLIVLEEMTIADAARAARCRYTNITAMVRVAAYRLRGGIGHLLPVREVGAMGGEGASS